MKDAKNALNYCGELQGVLRLFTAVEFEPHIQEKFARVQAGVLRHCVSGNFTQVKNIHLTLVFLGELSVANVPAIKRAMDEAMRGHTPFVLTANKLGAFSRGGKKIVWVGLSGEVQPLHLLYSRLEDTLIDIGVVNHKQTYSPHVTLGREVVLNVSLSDISLDSTLPFVVEVRAVSLMESRREQGRLVYRKIHGCGLCSLSARGI